MMRPLVGERACHDRFRQWDTGGGFGEDVDDKHDELAGTRAKSLAERSDGLDTAATGQLPLEREGKGGNEPSLLARAERSASMT